MVIVEFLTLPATQRVQHTDGGQQMQTLRGVVFSGDDGALALVDGVAHGLDGQLVRGVLLRL